MGFTRIKICGITRVEDACAATESGADAVGLVFFRASPRAVSLERATAIASAIPPFVSIVALFVDESATTIQSVLDALPIDVIQFHGDESPDFCRQFGRPWIKALRIRPELDVPAACSQYRGARAVLLDTWQEGLPGGTGKSFDWRLAAGALPLPVVVAGGLRADNVGDAIHALQPAAVDVSGGVESSPGVKDSRKIQQFIAAVRAADQKVYGETNGN